MDMWDLKKWRRALGYSQVDAAEMLGVSRGAIQHWESERTPVPTVVELACDELTRQWKQRPDFGPVVLIYSDELMWPEPDCPSRVLCLQREWFASNEASILRARRLKETPNFVGAFVADQHGFIIRNTSELLSACEKPISSGPESL
jgi:transcriptional regulator with XRE-family HTH domain